MANIIEHLQKGEFQKVLNFCDEELQKQPEDYNLLIVKGWCHYELGYLDQALSAMLEGITADQLHIFSISLAQNFFFVLEDNKQLVEISKKYLTLYPDNPSLLKHMAISQGKLGYIQDSIASFKRLLTIEPKAKVRTMLASLILKQMDYDEGFGLFEARFQEHKDCNWFYAKNLDIPLWQGEQLVGRSLLLWTEQGVGDTIQFCRYVTLLSSMGASVSIMLHGAHASVVDILRTLEGINAIYIANQESDNLRDVIDFHCPMMSLMHRLKFSLDTIPSSTPYLTDVSSHHSKWNFLKQDSKKIKIGLVWSTETVVSAHTAKVKIGRGDNPKSIQLKELQTILASEQIGFFSMQLHPTEDDKALMDQYAVEDLSDKISHFADTAAIIAHMDRVISIDTSVAHLAGAMNKPTLLLLPYVSDWRWLENRSDSPWYPSMRLFRQRKKGDWSEVLNQLRDLLKGLTA